MQGCTRVRWRQGQETSLAPPCSNLRPFGIKCIVLKKVICDNAGTFRRPPVIRHLGHFAPFPPLGTSLSVSCLWHCCKFSVGAACALATWSVRSQQPPCSAASSTDARLCDSGTLTIKVLCHFCAKLANLRFQEVNFGTKNAT